MVPNASERARWNDETWTREWPKREALTDSVTPVLLEALDLQPGERVLEVGCGGGKATIAASRQVQPGGVVVGADISEPLLGLARQRAADGTGVSFQRADMQVDQVDGADGDGGSFDVVMSQFGVMFFDDPVAAFTNIGRHLRPGGRLVFACWQPIDRNPWFPGAALAPFLASPPPPGPGKSPTGPFALGDHEHVGRVLSGAGFRQIAIDPRSHEVDVQHDAVVDDAQLRFMGIDADTIDAARQAVADYMQQFAISGDLLRLPLAYQIVSARSAG